MSASIEATANSEHLYRLLREKDPGFLAALELAVNRVDRELYGECQETQPPDHDGDSTVPGTDLAMARTRCRVVLGGLIHEYQQAA